MTSKHRVFASDNNMNYKDYLKNKMGTEILKTKKTKKENIRYFFNYNEFILLTNAYYKYLNCGDICYIKKLSDVNNTNESYILYEDVLKHVGDCDYCSRNIHTLCHVKCNDLLRILYPYGDYITNYKNNYRFNGQLDLNKWCIPQKDVCPNANYINTDLVNDYEEDEPCEENKTSLYYKNKKSIKYTEESHIVKTTQITNEKCGKYGLCKSTTALFVNC